MSLLTDHFVLLVWLAALGSTIGTWMGMAYSSSSSPETVGTAFSIRPTSVEVPPMSKPITFWWPAATAVRTMPTMPPAGPDRIASLPWNPLASASPPDDCMK